MNTFLPSLACTIVVLTASATELAAQTPPPLPPIPDQAVDAPLPPQLPTGASPGTPPAPPLPPTPVDSNLDPASGLPPLPTLPPLADESPNALDTSFPPIGSFDGADPFASTDPTPSFGDAPQSSPAAARRAAEQAADTLLGRGLSEGGLALGGQPTAFSGPGDRSRYDSLLRELARYVEERDFQQDFRHLPPAAGAQEWNPPSATEPDGASFDPSTPPASLPAPVEPPR